ncbi:hypothetical protein CLCR_02689 [Cladophialophora carrionii]|uniref:Uncharacterized protein n=1 Tax=Cladophialophora carrionii TaxID=86049 RepID=A0A1C1CFE8_9EURO|nr:hypothetical protein CLCR_02689 [Cladophialophora carrionii]
MQVGRLGTGIENDVARTSAQGHLVTRSERVECLGLFIAADESETDLQLLRSSQNLGRRRVLHNPGSISSLLASRLVAQR